ncbi:uncharacterized protein LOC115792131 [Archocentrus centrarchus]|uniref:uncharacterized protein LOC115792131 n=1 Tax=Archocentrus centrarchus TaxID=63155 RepID=UPI0011EA3881|nr:uncharacterized protein LOC115792131 [Archocentrus centrarchus]
MGEIEAMVYLLLGLWIFVRLRASEASQRRLQAARHNTREKYRRVLEAIQQYHTEDEIIRRRRRKMMALLLRNSRRQPSVWTFMRASQWWDVIVPAFTNAQWVQNFRMSREVLHSLCNKLRPAMERRDTTFRECVPVRKRVGNCTMEACYWLPTAEALDIFLKSAIQPCADVCRFLCSSRDIAGTQTIRYPDEERFREWLITLSIDGGSHTVWVLLMAPTYPSSPHNVHTD